MADNQKNRYDDWNLKKQIIQQNEETSKIYFKECDIWWCALGINIGSESFGKGNFFRRPILIIKKLSADLCVAIPLTSQRKEGTWFIDITIDGEIKYAMLYQIRTLNKKRFQHKIGQLGVMDFSRVKEKLEALLELSKNHHPADAGIEGIAPKSNDSISKEMRGGQ